MLNESLISYKERLRYLDDPNFKLKWGLIKYLIQYYYLDPYVGHRILDLGCGESYILDYFNLDEIELYVGIDDNENILGINKGKTRYKLSYHSTEDKIFYFHENIENIKTDILIKTFGLFNIILWCGIGVGVGKWPAIINRFHEVLKVGGILILDYQDIPPNPVQKRIVGVEGFHHVTGCGLSLDNTPVLKMKMNPTVYKRRIELFRKVK